MQTASLGVALLLLALTLPACSVKTRPSLAPKEVERLAAMEYPADQERGDDLDIIVVHKADTLLLVNRTPRAYRDVTLWLNQQYVRPLDAIDIGTENRIDLRTAVNEHGQSYPVGSFLKPDKRMQLVQAEIVDPTTNRRHRLTVQPTPDPSRR